MVKKRNGKTFSGKGKISRFQWILNLPFKDASVFVVGRETFFNEWDGHCYYHSVC